MHPSRTRLLLALSFAVPFLALTLYWACFIRAGYYPSRDEFSLLVASTKMFHPAISTWFLEGYSRYFLSYPGLSHPATDFLRPGANLAYYLNSVVFGARWSWYLLLTYAIQAGIVCLCVKLAIEAFKVPAKLALALGFAVFLSPSFGWEQIFIPSFTIDLLGAFFVVFALHELWHKRHITAWLLLAAAVFTKETTLFAPVMAALAVWLPSRKPGNITRRLALSLIWITPILAWALLRRLAFHGDAGIYVLQNMALSGKIANVLHGFLAWPFGTRNAQQSVQLRLLYFPLNGAFWLTCLWAATRIFKRKQAPIEDPNPLPALVLFCAGAFAMPVLLNLPQRFGASVYPLFFLLLAALIASTDDRLISTWAAACLAIATCVSIYQKAVDPLTMQESRAEWALSANYIQTIHTSKAPYLLLVDDSSGGFANPDLVARFADFHGTLMRSNNIEGLSLHQCATQPIITKAPVSAGDLHITSVVTPPCGYYAFDSLSTRELEHATDGLITHPANLTLLTTPPAAQPLPRSGLQQMFGTLTVEMKNPPSNLTLLTTPPAAQPLPRSGLQQMFGTLTVEMKNPPSNLTVLIPDLANLRYKELN